MEEGNISRELSEKVRVNAFFSGISGFFRRTQEGRGGLRRESPGAFPKAGSIFQQPFSLPNLGRDSISCCRKIGAEFSSSVEICPKTFPAANFGQPQPSRVF